MNEQTNIEIEEIEETTTKNEDIKKLVELFNESLVKVKFNYPTYSKHLREMLVIFIEKRILEIEAEEYKHQDHNGNVTIFEYDDYSYFDDLEDEIEIEFNKINQDLVLFKKNHQIFKLKSKLLLSTTSLEDFSDKINYILYRHKGEKLLNSILSNKYKNLIKTNKEKKEKLITLFCKLLDNGMSEEELQMQLGKKLATVKSFDDFYERSKNVLEGYSKSFLKIFKVIKDNELNVDIIKSDIENNVLIINVHDYHACNKLGATSWCIQYNNNFFTDYVEVVKGISCKGINNAQLIIWNFDEEQISKTFMYGVTINKAGIKAAHYQDDSMCEHSEILEKYPEILEYDYWKTDDAIVVPTINNSDLKRNQKLELLIGFAKDDIHLYETYEYLSTQFPLNISNYLWLARYTEIWENRLKNVDLTRKQKYLDKMEEYFSDHNDYEKYFYELRKDIKQSMVKEKLSKF
jgi:hypothetical protein